MELNAVDQDDAIAFTGIFVDIDRKAAGGRADLIDFHRGQNRSTDGFFGNSVAAKNFHLSFGGSAAVAAHGRDQNGLAALFLDKFGNRTDDVGILIDPAAAAGDGNAGTGSDRRAFFFEAAAKRADDVFENIIVEGLTDQGDLRDLIIFQEFADSIQDGILFHDKIL